MNALAPMARLMGAGDLMVEYDQRYEHYGVPQPQLLALQLLADPARADRPRRPSARPGPTSRSVSTLNEQDLAVPGNVGWPSPIVTYTVANPRPMLRGESDSGAVVMEGDATGLNNLAGLGLLNTDSAIYYAGTLADQPAQLHEPGRRRAPSSCVTDTNRKQAFRWDTLTANAGYTETPSDEPGQDRPERQPDRALPRAPASRSKTVRQLRRRRQRHGQQLRQLGLLHARGPGLQRHRRQLRHGLDHGHLRARPGRASGGRRSSPTRSRPTTSPWSSRSGATARAGSPRSRSPSTARTPITLRPDEGLARCTSGQTLTFPTRTFHTLRVTIDGTTDDTRAAAHGVGGRLRRGGDPRASRCTR